MSEFIPKSLCISGRLPALSVAELEALYGSQHLRPIEQAVLLDIETTEIDFRRLGGTLKLARVLNILPSTKWNDLEKYLLSSIPTHLKYAPEGSFTLGLSVYGLDVPLNTVSSGLMRIKKKVRASGRSMRIVPNKALELNSAQVLHNKLTTKGAWELLLVRDGQRTILAQTIFVQDIEAYAARDQARPKRDSRVGMLPPKLAQTIINLAAAPAGSTVLDPFCGSGVILQEALLMGYGAIGSDIDPRMVSFAKANLKWLAGQKPDLQTKVAIEPADAIKHKWQSKFDAVVSEIYLGRPLGSLPPRAELNGLVGEVDTLLSRFLKNISGQISKGTPLSLAVPAWRLADKTLLRLPILDHLTDMGYNYLDFKHVAREDLIYFREDQIVARQLIRISKD